jgi:hypothetical protein
MSWLIAIFFVVSAADVNSKKLVINDVVNKTHFLPAWQSDVYSRSAQSIAIDETCMCPTWQ